MPPNVDLPPRAIEVLRDLPEGEAYVRPMDVGGADGSHHSATLARLAALGLAERRKRHQIYCTYDAPIAGTDRRSARCCCRGSYHYRRSAAGTAWLAAHRNRPA